MNLKSNKAITLVALIITIIILLILAGVTLSMVLGDNGLINKAQSSVDKYQQSANNEQAILDSIEDYFKEYMPGEEMPLPDGWDETTVTAVSDGKHNIIPVPKDFYYVGGNLGNGVIISDDPADAYDGITDKTTWEYTTSLVGNQFVWIPCTTTDYVKKNWGIGITTFDMNDQTTEETRQIATYGGFFVGRYEAGLASSISEYTTDQLWNSTVYNKVGIPKSKAGVLPWGGIDYTNSKTNAESMYNTTKLKSGLITGTQWDVMLKKIIGTTNQSNITFTESDLTDSNKWGNYYNTNILYTGRSTTYNNSNSMFSTWSATTKTEKTRDTGIYTILTTGASKSTEAYHTYDVAGNMWEFTTEIALNDDERVIRSGNFYYDSDVVPTCKRGYFDVSNVDLSIGFRVVLYIQ